MIKHYDYTAKESIAWCRVCRPGSVVGPQQQYLAALEGRLQAEGIAYRKQNGLPDPREGVVQRSPAGVSASSSSTPPIAVSNGWSSSSAQGAHLLSSNNGNANGGSRVREVKLKFTWRFLSCDT